VALPPVIDPYPDHTEALCKALGRGLLRWQYVETGLYLIAMSLMATDHGTASRIFFHIRSAKNKLELVDRLVTHKVDQATRTKLWKELASDIRAAIDFRNCLAHFEPFMLTPEGFAKIKTKYRVAISYHNLDEHANSAGSTKTFTVEDIEHNTDEMRFLAYKIIYFLIDHIPQLEQLLERLPQDLRQCLDSFRKMKRPPEFTVSQK
jgi:hypothetical protein